MTKVKLPTKAEHLEDNKLIQTIENEQALALKAAKEAIGDFGESTKLKNHARALISAAIFTKFKQSSHNFELANKLLTAQKDAQHADVMTHSIALCVALGWIDPDTKDEKTQMDKYKELDKANKGLLQAMRDCNKFAIAAWKHSKDTLLLVQSGNRLLVRVREDFYIKNDSLTPNDTRTIGNVKGSVSFEEVLRTSKANLGLTNTNGRQGGQGQGKTKASPEINLEIAVSFINSVIETGNTALGVEMLSRLDRLAVRLFNYVKIERDLEKQKNPLEKAA